MAIFLEKAIFVNRAPFEKISLDFNSNEISVLSAVNGKGKTTILSHIVDAIHEMARPHFSNEYEGKENKYYRFSSSVFNININIPSFVYFRFINDSEVIDYLDIRNKCTEEEYNNAIEINNKIPFTSFSGKFENSNNIKYVTNNANKNKIESIFNNNVLTYFPAYRHEQPGYLNDPYKVKLKFHNSMNFAGYLPNKIEVVTGLNELANWMMDIVLDSEIYKGNSSLLLTRQNLNTVITHTLSSKVKSNFRIGIGERNLGYTRIQIVNSDSNLPLYPSIFNLSSGESSIICLFGELVKQADIIRRNNNNLTGIVLIDEIDKHLHIKLQKEVLPKLFQLFPNVQFIVSSHSPFLSMGLAEQAYDRSKIIDLDNYGISKDPTSCELYNEVYTMMIGENERFKENYEHLQQLMQNGTKPLIITEGKTDIKYIQKAIVKLKIDDLDIEYIDPANQPDGYSNLKALLEKVSKIGHSRKVIGIFDRDQTDITKDIEKDAQPYKNYGNGVFGFCISTPQSRILSGQNSISIEYLFSDNEIKSILPNGCRLFFGTEFNGKSLKHNTESLLLSKPDGKGIDKIIENNGGQAVYDFNDTNVLAKKDDFAEAILKDEIQISDASWLNFQHIFDKIKTIIVL